VGFDRCTAVDGNAVTRRGGNVERKLDSLRLELSINLISIGVIVGKVSSTTYSVFREKKKVV